MFCTVGVSDLQAQSICLRPAPSARSTALTKKRPVRFMAGASRKQMFSNRPTPDVLPVHGSSQKQTSNEASLALGSGTGNDRTRSHKEGDIQRLEPSVSADNLGTTPTEAVCDPISATGFGEVQRLIRTPKQCFHPLAGQTLGHADADREMSHARRHPHWQP